MELQKPRALLTKKQWQKWEDQKSQKSFGFADPEDNEIGHSANGDLVEQVDAQVPLQLLLPMVKVGMNCIIGVCF